MTGQWHGWSCSWAPCVTGSKAHRISMTNHKAFTSACQNLQESECCPSGSASQEGVRFKMLPVQLLHAQLDSPAPSPTLLPSVNTHWCHRDSAFPGSCRSHLLWDVLIPAIQSGLWGWQKCTVSHFPRGCHYEVRGASHQLVFMINYYQDKLQQTCH